MCDQKNVGSFVVHNSRDHPFHNDRSYEAIIRESYNDDACPSSPSTSTTYENIEAVKKKMTLNNHRITVREDADDVGISFGSFHAIFTNYLGMRRATTTTIKKVITVNESWVCSYHIETKAQTSQWKVFCYN